jgi:hypothetical protein
MSNFTVEIIKKNISQKLLCKSGVHKKKGNEIHVKDLKIFMHDKQLLEVYDSTHHKIIKLFIDIEIKKSLIKNNLEFIRNKRQSLIDFYKNNNWYIVDFSRYIDKKHIKLSFHLIHKNLAFKTIIALKKYVRLNYHHYEGIDYNVYKNTYFNFRAPGQSKWNETNGKIGKIINGKIENCLITQCFKDYKILSLDSKPHKNYKKEWDIDIIEKLLDILPSKYYDDYTLWMNICFALKCLKEHDRAYNLFMNFSQKSPKFKFSEANKKWTQIESERDDKITPDSIHFYARTENEIKYDEIIYPKSYQEKFMNSEGLTYQDFTRKWLGKKIYDTTNFINDMRQVMGYFDDGNIRYIFKNKGGYSIKKRHELHKYKIFLCDKPYNFYSILELHGLTSIQYDDIKFKPTKIEDPYIFNLWSGFVSKPTRNMDLVKPILKHIKKVWAGNNLESYNYILTWFANILQKPDEKNSTVLVLIGGQGCGKNILTNFISEHVIGEKYCETINDLNRVTHRFNSIIENKIFITLDEISNIEKNYHKTFDILKNIITEDIRIIEKKGFEPKKIHDFCNYIMLSNNFYPVKVEGMDRRYAIFECNNMYVNNKDYFDSFKKKLNKKSGNAFAHFLLNFDINKRKLIDIPDTKIRRDLIYNSIPNKLLFLYNFISNKDTSFILSNDLWKEYQLWCYNSNSNSGTIKSFLMYVSKFLEKHRKRVKNSNLRGFLLNKKLFIKKVKELTGYDFT